MLVPRSALAIAALAISSASGQLTVDLIQGPSDGDGVAQALQAASKYFSTSSSDGAALPAEPETLSGGFWYGNFDVGDSKNLSLLIDTGSSGVFVNPTDYKPSKESEDQNITNTVEYITTMEDGCGNATIKYHVYRDEVSAQGLVAKNQSLGVVIKTPPPNSGTITKYPHQGIVGMSGAKSSVPQKGAIPWFQNLCDQGQVKQCEFGLAFGTNGKGSQILGGIDTSLFSGNLIYPLPSEYPGSFQTSVIVNNTKLALFNRTIIYDSGTANLVAPIADVEQVFKDLGLQYATLNKPGCSEVVFGYYPCDKPATLGLQPIISKTAKGKTDEPVFNIEPSAFQQDNNGHNNCTAILVGLPSSELPPATWIVGQAWFQGKYYSQNGADTKIGYAELKQKKPSGYS